jgi:hypothetical protein
MKVLIKLIRVYINIRPKTLQYVVFFIVVASFMIGTIMVIGKYDLMFFIKSFIPIDGIVKESKLSNLPG